MRRHGMFRSWADYATVILAFALVYIVILWHDNILEAMGL